MNNSKTLFLLLFVLTAFAKEYSLVTVKVYTESEFVCLFVHGHRGHYSQANLLQAALGSVCDFYSADLLEDISGLSHEVIYKQADFVEGAIKELWEKKEKKIVLICHSMGGISGLLAGFLHYEYIERVFVLNSPLDHSPVNTYIGFPVLYSKVHKIIESEKLTIVSITGADDSMVPAVLTKALELKTQHFYTSSLISEQFDHNTILTNKNFLKLFPELLNPNKKFAFQNWILDEDSSSESFSDCDIPVHPDPIFIGSTKVTEQKWVALKIEKDSILVFKSKEKIEQVCRGIRNLILSSLATQNSQYLKLTALEGEEYFMIAPEGEIEINKVKVLSCLRFYYKVCVFNTDGPIMIRVGSILRSPLLIESTKNIDWIYSRCGTEEIYIKNTQELLIKFHEDCKQGVEVWIYSQKGKIQLKTPILEIIYQVVKDFRLEILSIAFCFLFCKKSFTLVLLLAYWAAGPYFRYTGLLFLDHSDFYNKKTSLFETFLISLCGFIFSQILKALSFFLLTLQKPQKSTKAFSKYLYFFLFFPWPGLYFSFITHSRTISLQELNLILTFYILTIPQQISFFYKIFIQFSLTLPNFYDFCSVLPICLFLSVPSTELKLNELLLGSIFVLLTQDLLYRGQLFLTLLIISHLLQHIKHRVLKQS